MPEISFYKSKKDNSIKVYKKNEDNLYIVKDSNNRGRIYFDYDNNTRIEIGSTDNILCYKDETTNLDNSIITIQVNKFNCFYKYNENGELIKLVSPYSEIEINKVVSTNKGLFLINKLNDTELTMSKIYEPEKIKWNDYFINKVNNTSITGDAIAGEAIVGN